MDIKDIRVWSAYTNQDPVWMIKDSSTIKKIPLARQDLYDPNKEINSPLL